MDIIQFNLLIKNASCKHFLYSIGVIVDDFQLLFPQYRREKFDNDILD